MVTVAVDLVSSQGHGGGISRL